MTPVAEIVRATARAFGVSEPQVLIRERWSQHNHVRHAVWLLGEQAGLSLSQIGRVFGRSPTTISQGIEHARDMLALDRDFAAVVRGVRGGVDG